MFFAGQLEKFPAGRAHIRWADPAGSWRTRLQILTRRHHSKLSCRDGSRTARVDCTSVSAADRLYCFGRLLPTSACDCEEFESSSRRDRRWSQLESKADWVKNRPLDW